jgi:hypothetical protein
MVPVDSVQVSRDWTYSGAPIGVTIFAVRGCHPLWPTFPDRSTNNTLHILKSYNPERETLSVWAVPISLAATDGIDFSFSSSGYLDVSVHQVVTDLPMDSAGSIRVPRDHRLFVSSPRLFADFHALHRLLTPRHPPCALSRLAIEIPNSATPVQPNHPTMPGGPIAPSLEP